MTKKEKKKVKRKEKKGGNKKRQVKFVDDKELVEIVDTYMHTCTQVCMSTCIQPYTSIQLCP